MSTETLTINEDFDFTGVSSESTVSITIGCPTGGVSPVYVNVYDWEAGTWSGDQQCGTISEGASVDWSWGDESGSGSGLAAHEHDPLHLVPVVPDPGNRVPYAPSATA